MDEIANTEVSGQIKAPSMSVHDAQEPLEVNLVPDGFSDIYTREPEATSPALRYSQSSENSIPVQVNEPEVVYPLPSTEKTPATNSTVQNEDEHHQTVADNNFMQEEKQPELPVAHDSPSVRTIASVSTPMPRAHSTSNMPSDIRKTISNLGQSLSELINGSESKNNIPSHDEVALSPGSTAKKSEAPAASHFRVKFPTTLQALLNKDQVNAYLKNWEAWLANHQHIVEIAGWYGAAAILLAYFLVSYKLVSATSVLYQFLNLTGAISFILISITHKVRQVALLNVVWAAIALMAIVIVILHY